jgi:hypothetical protein
MKNKSYSDPVTIIKTAKNAVQLDLEPAPVKMGVIFYEAVTSKLIEFFHIHYPSQNCLPFQLSLLFVTSALWLVFLIGPVRSYPVLFLDSHNMYTWKTGQELLCKKNTV